MTTDTSSLWESLSVQADRLLEEISNTAPAWELKVDRPLDVAVGMFWRARRLYDGVLILLKAHLPEEAVILARSLFEESLRLQQLAAEPENRVALLVGWANNSISEASA